MRKGPLKAVPVLLAAGLAAAGCGGDGRLDHQELITKATKICTVYEQQQNDVKFPSVNPVAPRTKFIDRAKWGASLNMIVLLGRQELAALRDLRPPEELEARYNRLLNTMGKALNGLADGAEAAKRNRPAELKKSVNAARVTLAKVTALAKQLGLPKCG